MTTDRVTTATDTHGLVDRLAATIQARVLSGEITTGTRLRQESLASEFGVSRTPVREALRQLQANGLVSVEPNRGAVVRGPTVRDIREAYAVRAELEGFAAQLATPRLDDAQLDQLREAEQLFRHSVEELIEDRRERSSLPERVVPQVRTEIEVDNDVSADFSVIDVYTQDRPGVLYTITRTLARLRLDIHLSKVATEASRVGDVFYVRELDGGKVLLDERQKAIAEKLRAAIGTLEAGI